MAMRFSDLLISMTVLTLFVSIFLIVMTAGSTTYGVGFDNSSPIFSKSVTAFNNISASVEDTQNRAMDISTDQGLLDIVGAMFSQGYQAIKTSVVAYAQTAVLLSVGIDILELGAVGKVVTNAFTTILIIIVFIAIFLRIIVKEQV